jgi:very-short-patch-repair endonuclease
MELYRERDRLLRIIMADDNRRWNAIRDLYKTVDVTEYDPYLIDWTLLFSPIESMAWGEIRYLGLPFWPQFPIGKYFADFANPIKKIVIECDGKEFHSQAQDCQRDAFMIGEGWTVYRISGADCNRVMKNPWEEILSLGLESDDSQAERIIHEWLHTTVDGLIAAISYGHFAKPSGRSDYFRNEAMCVLKARKARGF